MMMMMMMMMMVMIMMKTYFCGIVHLRTAGGRISRRGHRQEAVLWLSLLLFFDYLGVMNIRTKFHACITIYTILIIPCASGMDCTIVTSQNAKVGIDSKIAETVILSANTTPQRHMGGNMSLKRLHYLVSLTGFQS